MTAYSLKTYNSGPESFVSKRRNEVEGEQALSAQLNSRQILQKHTF